MFQHSCHACREFNNLSRRQFMTLTGAATAAAATLPAWMPRMSFGGGGIPGRDVFVQIYLRGGADGLSLVVPHAEYDRLLAVRRPLIEPYGRPVESNPNTIRDLDGYFGLLPPMAPLRTIYNANDLLVVHATGSRDETRSHFDAMYYMEVGRPQDRTLTTGWLGRLITQLPEVPGTIVRNMSLGTALPQTIVGAPKAQAVPDPLNFNLGGDDYTIPFRRSALRTMYDASTTLLRASAQNTQATIDLIQRIGIPAYVPRAGATYETIDNSPLAVQLKAAAAVIKARVGVESITIDLGGWDTHSEQGTAPGEYMHTLMRNLATNLYAFWYDVLDAGYRNVTLAVMSEFGRNVGSNGSRGTDHGHGNVMFVISGHVNGGQVYTNNWPTTYDGALYQGQDLEVTVDYRDILAEIVRDRLAGSAYLPQLFPGFTPTDRGLFTT